MFSLMFVGLFFVYLRTRLLKQLWTDFHETWWADETWKFDNQLDFEITFLTNFCFLVVIMSINFWNTCPLYKFIYLLFARCASWNRYSTSNATCRAQNAQLWRCRCASPRPRWRSGSRTAATNGNVSWRPNWKRPTWLTPPLPPSDWRAYHSSTANIRRQTALLLPRCLIFHPRLRPSEREIIFRLPIIRLEDFHPHWTIMRRCSFLPLTTGCAHLFQTSFNNQCCDCRPRGKSLSSRILEDQFASLCPCLVLGPRTTSPDPWPCPRALSPW